jgi:hypothetical protein
MCYREKLKVGPVHSVTVPNNGIDLSGQQAIKQLLEEEETFQKATKREGCVWLYEFLPFPPKDWSWDWCVNGRGEYVGTLPKRLQKYYYNEWKIKLGKETISQIGNLGRQHCPKTEQVGYFFDFTQTFDWDAGDFGDDGSCFWSCHAAARDMLAENGAYAIRFYEDKNGEDGYARAWLVRKNDYLVVFNGYGMETLRIARILSAYLDNAYYKRISLTNNYEESGTLYINGGGGFLVGSQQVVNNISSLDFGWGDAYCCTECGDRVDDEYRNNDGERFCETCFYERYQHCKDCGEILCEYEQYVYDFSVYCNSCFDAFAAFCPLCGEATHNDDIHATPAGERCETCADRDFFKCAQCGEYEHTDIGADSGQYCEPCFEDKFTSCDACHKPIWLDKAPLCTDCSCDEMFTADTTKATATVA